MRIVTFHPFYNLKPIFAIRDVGQIGQYLSSLMNGTSEVWCLRESKEQHNFNVSRQSWTGYDSFLGMLWALVRRGSSIDVLHLYHISWRSIMACLVFRARSHGAILLKADMPFINTPSHNFITVAKCRLVLCLVDIFAVEDARFVQVYLTRNGKSPCNVRVMTSGVDSSSFYETQNKSDMIMMCGRFGVGRKNYELVIDALKGLKKDSVLWKWRFALVGPRTEAFDARLKELFDSTPGIEDLFEIHGELTYRDEVNRIYSRSKILLHPAVLEGDPNVQYEAMWCGCMLVCADIANISQNYPEEFRLYIDPTSAKSILDTLLQAILILEKSDSTFYSSIHNYASNKFTWQKILTPIAQDLGRLIS